MKNEVTIECINTYSQQLLEACNKLLSQLNVDIPKRTEEFMRRLMQSSTAKVFVARDIDSGEIVAMTTLVIYQVLSGKRATIEDVVVDEEYRRKGIGKKLLEEVLAVAHKENVSYIDLTSRPSRIEANNLYQSLGFEKRDTNVYRYIIK